MELMKRLFSLDSTGFDTPDGALALDKGLLKAKKDAYGTAQIMSYLGRPLELMVLLVSFLHIYTVMAAIKPSGVSQLIIRPELYHFSEGAFTLMIDGALLYILTSASVARYVGDNKWWYEFSRLFFYILTALGNGIFIWKNSSDLVVGTQAALLPYLNTAFVICLTVLVPVALVAIEGGHRRVETTRLGLLVETTALDARIKGAGDSLLKKLAEAEHLIGNLRKDAQELASKLTDEASKRLFSDTAAQAAEEALSQKKEELVSLQGEHKTLVEQYEAAVKQLSEVPTTQAQIVPEIGDCPSCGNPLTITDQSVSARPFWQARLSGEVFCKDCRELKRLH